MANITFGTIPLPNIQWDGDVSALLTNLAGHLTASLDQGAITGQMGGGQPATNVGVWLNNNTLEGYSIPDGSYLPFPMLTGALFGGVLYTTQLLSGAASNNVFLNLPNQNGKTLATKLDLSTPPGLLVFFGTSPTIDWTALGHEGRFYVNMNGNVTFNETFSTPPEGTRIEIWMEQALAASGAQTVTFPSAYILSGGAITLQTRSSATTRYIDHISVLRTGTYTIVEKMGSYTIPTTGAGSDTTPPSVVSISAVIGTPTITVATSKTLFASGANPTDWVINRNGVSNPTIGVPSVKGNNLTVTVTNSFNASDTGTLQYKGTGVRDLAQNLMPPFSAKNITLNAASLGSGRYLLP